MKKLSRNAGKVHPITSDDYLSLLPPTILALTVALSPQDKHVLAYLISCSSAAAACGTGTGTGTGGNKSKSGGVDHHPASFNCNCFSCYMSYWVKWDASPNRQVIHEIIDAFEEERPSSSSSLKKNKKQRRKRSKGSNELSNELDRELQVFEGVSVEEKTSGGEEVDGGGELVVEETDQKSSVRSVLNFLGGKFWSLLVVT